ncbi:MAG: hypothetical protein AVDCRST_MAG78-2020 [uncultured Rubrobacteraceae bacterium]|uniref:Uncharacterized protein n=1 Tax=uncultured Rubrobacteraceae bacterium TaxID=349277 RepID=A0A6J4QBC0_9ACTN|nr:MAG: hypothetical protein AVDCRST_MAG78-2020 [uncultured Rubrobacteraceae bacterium]
MNDQVERAVLGYVPVDGVEALLQVLAVHEGEPDVVAVTGGQGVAHRAIPPVREPVPVMRVGPEAGDHVVNGVGVPRLRDGPRTLYDVREGGVRRYLQRDLDVSSGAHTPAGEGSRGQAGPQHDAVFLGTPGGHAQRKGIAGSRSHAAPFDGTPNSNPTLPRGVRRTAWSTSSTPSTMWPANQATNSAAYGCSRGWQERRGEPVLLGRPKTPTCRLEGDVGKRKRRRVKPRVDQERLELPCAWDVYATF